MPFNNLIDGINDQVKRNLDNPIKCVEHALEYGLDSLPSLTPVSREHAGDEIKNTVQRRLEALNDCLNAFEYRLECGL
ncbi:hypothetical protein D3C73_1315750 [compost metagenome]